jgi:antitoxin component of MazEF toxin-antitoxin module
VKGLAKVQVQNGSFMVAIPPKIMEFLEAEKGTKVDFKINKKTLNVEVIKVEEDKK